MKAPGEIVKPFIQSKPRGRPPLSQKHFNMDENRHEPEIGFKLHSNTYKENFQTIANLLAEVPSTQEISPILQGEENEKILESTMNLFEKFL